MNYTELFLKAIKKRIIIKENVDTSQSQTKYHIGFGINAEYARYMGVSIRSFIHNQKSQLVFHVIANFLKEDDVLNLKKMAEQYGAEMTIYLMDDQPFKLITDKFPIPTFYRFLLPIILKDLDKVLYVDSDIICLKNIESIFKIDLGNHIIAAVPDSEETANKRINELGLTNHRYFNAGLMIINIANWNKNDITEKAFEMAIAKKDQFALADQDVLNLLLKNKMFYLEREWNYFFDLRNSKTDEKIVFLHYASTPKPWSVLFPNNIENLYLQYEHMSPWVNSPLVLPIKYREIRTYARTLLAQKDYINGFKWYMKYLQAKVKKIVKHL